MISAEKSDVGLDALNTGTLLSTAFFKNHVARLYPPAKYHARNRVFQKHFINIHSPLFCQRLHICVLYIPDDLYAV